MVYKISDNIISPLGFTTEENFRAVKDGRTALCRRRVPGVPGPVTASMFNDGIRRLFAAEERTLFDSLAAESAGRALEDAGIDPSKEDTVFILSTTKGNIDLLRTEGDIPENFFPGVTARRIAAGLGIKTVPVTVCNACISGLSAVILACRFLEAGLYRHAVVCGCDVVSGFVTEGFRSLQIMSGERCRPFDIERNGLNLGEASATIVLSSAKKDEGACWAVERGAVRNDAWHISTPSKQGEGMFRALRAVTEGKRPENIALVNAHGTATLFNDQMEVAALRRAGLSSLPVNGLKGYFGHTMGAAGVLETVLTMRALDEGVIPFTRGFEETGVSGNPDIVRFSRRTGKRQFLKLLAGFGGCNAAVIAKKVSGETKPRQDGENISAPSPRVLHRVRITPAGAALDGREVETDGSGTGLITNLYKSLSGDYPRFFKMDMLSRLGFVATRLLLGDPAEETPGSGEERALAFFNRSASVAADRNFLRRMSETGEEYSSPALFVYTLPNIVTGETAMYRHWHGETAFYILPEKDEGVMDNILRTLFLDGAVETVTGGWLDYAGENDFEADIRLLARQ